ncbi:hypothetical protein MKW92_042031, partial [Papaver armeniacum]
MYNHLIKGALNKQISTGQQKFWLRIWHLQVPHKILIFIWKCLQDILPTKIKLIYHLPRDDSLCPWCFQETETPTHIIFHCDVAIAVWFAILPEALDSIKSHTAQDWIQSWNNQRQLLSFQNAYRVSLAAVTLWHLWKHRCLK